MTLAQQLRQTAQDSVDQAEVQEIVRQLTDKATRAANRGETNCNVHIYDDKYVTVFDYSDYNRTKSLQRHVRASLEKLGFVFDERHGVNGLYGVISW